MNMSKTRKEVTLQRGGRATRATSTFPHGAAAGGPGVISSWAVQRGGASALAVPATGPDLVRVSPGGVDAVGRVDRRNTRSQLGGAAASSSLADRPRQSQAAPSGAQSPSSEPTEQGLGRNTNGESFGYVCYPRTGPLKCPWCEFSVTQIAKLKEHSGRVHPGMELRAKCQGCDRVSDNFRSVSCHSIRCPGGADRGAGPHAQEDRGESQCVLTVCEVCGAGFKTPLGLAQHERHLHPELRNRKRIEAREKDIKRKRDARVAAGATRKNVKWTEGETNRLAWLCLEFKDDPCLNEKVAAQMAGKSAEQVKSRRRTKAFRQVWAEVSATENSGEHTPESREQNVRPAEDYLPDWEKPEGELGARAYEVLTDICSSSAGYVEVAELVGLICTRARGSVRRRPETDRRRPGPHRKRSARRAKRYAYIQRLYDRDRKRLFKEIVDGLVDGPSSSILSPEVVEAYYANKLEEPNNWCPDYGQYPLPPAADAAVLTEPISPEQVLRKLKSMKTNTAAGPDGVTLRQWRSFDRSGRVLAALFRTFQVLGRMPSILKVAKTVLLPKTAEASECKDFRPITIGQVLSRIFSSLMADRFSSAFSLHGSQRGFLPCNGTKENLAILDGLLRDGRSGKRNIAVAFLDLEKAFDSVGHKALGETLKRHLIDDRTAALVTDMYTDAYTRVQVGTSSTRELKIQRGVRQGDPLSPILFNLLLDPVFRQLEAVGAGVRVGEITITALAFADDIALIAESPGALQRALERVDFFAEAHGLSFHIDKCAWFSMRKMGRSFTLNEGAPALALCAQEVPLIKPGDHYKYLGALIGGWSKKVGSNQDEDWLSRAVSALGRTTELSAKQRLDLLQTFVVPKLLYRLTISLPPRKVLLSMDRILRIHTRRWSHLPPYASKGFLHSSVRDGGLGVPKLSALVPKIFVRERSKMILSDDPSLRECARLWGWQTTISRAVRLHRMPTWEGTRPYQYRYQGRERLRWAKLQTQGLGARSFWGEPAVNSWIRSKGGKLSGNEWVLAVQMRVNCYPTRAVLARGIPTFDRTCRRCGDPVESLTHILGVCRSVQRQRIRRHHRIAAALERRLRPAWTIRREVEFRTDQGAFRPDLVIFNDRTAFVVDVTVRMETYRKSLADAFRGKSDKYRCLEGQIRDTTGCDEVLFYGFVVGARGAWCRKNDPALKAMGIEGRALRSLKSEMTLISIGESVRMLRDFNRPRPPVENL